MKQACNGCGRADVAMNSYRCTWPDGRLTVERHCHACRVTWQPQLRFLGATLDDLSAPEPRVAGVLRLR